MLRQVEIVLQYDAVVFHVAFGIGEHEIKTAVWHNLFVYKRRNVRKNDKNKNIYLYIDKCQNRAYSVYRIKTKEGGNYDGLRQIATHLAHQDNAPEEVVQQRLLELYKNHVNEWNQVQEVLLENIVL